MSDLQSQDNMDNAQTTADYFKEALGAWENDKARIKELMGQNTGLDSKTKRDMDFILESIIDNVNQGVTIFLDNRKMLQSIFQSAFNDSMKSYSLNVADLKEEGDKNIDKNAEEYWVSTAGEIMQSVLALASALEITIDSQQEV